MLSTALLIRYLKKGFVFVVAFTIMTILFNLFGLDFSAGIPSSLAPLTVFAFAVSTVALGWLVEFVNKVIR